MEQKTNLKFSDDELKLIKNTFNGNDELLMALKKFMFQIELNEREDIAIKKAFKDNKELARVLRKFLLPTLEDKNVDVQSMTDLWVELNREINFRDRRVDDALPLLNAANYVIEYLDGQIRVLEGEENVSGGNLKALNKIEKDESGRADANKENYINIFARDLIFRRVENVIAGIWATAFVKEETPEEMIKRLKANSNK